MEKCSGEITVENKDHKDMIKELADKGYDPDPERVWRAKVNRDRGEPVRENSFLNSTESYVQSLCFSFSN